MIHILTLSWNGLDKLKSLKDGLYKNLDALGQNYKWYIRDNGSKDNTVEEIINWENVVTSVQYHNRDNFAAGVNSLFLLAEPDYHDYILLLNNDVVFNDDKSLSNMFNLLNDKTSVVGAKLLYPDNNLLQHAGVIFGQRYGCMPYHFKHKEPNDIDAGKNRYFQAVTAAVCFVKVSEFKAIAGMNSDLSWAFEDIDMCLSIGQLGKNIAYCGQTNISHIESASLAKNPVNKMFLQKNLNHFKNKWWQDGKPKYKLDHELYLQNSNYNLIK